MLINCLRRPLLLFVPAILIVSGCNRQAATLAPEIVGTLIIDGRPASGAEVLVGFSGENDEPCKGLEPAATVDGTGSFGVHAKTARLSKQEIDAIPYGTTPSYVCFRYRGQLFIDSMFLIKPTDRYILTAKCVGPRPISGYDDGLCWWSRSTSNNSSKPTPLRGAA